METMSLLFPVDLIRVKIIIIKAGQGKIMIGIKKNKSRNVRDRVGTLTFKDL